jgi:hypothetical protein
MYIRKICAFNVDEIDGSSAYIFLLGLIHTRHFEEQYCDIVIKRYRDKKTFFIQYFCPV